MRKGGSGGRWSPCRHHRLSYHSLGSGSGDLGLASCAFTICDPRLARRARLWGAHLDIKLTAHPAQAEHLTSNHSQIHQASSDFILVFWPISSPSCTDREREGRQELTLPVYSVQEPGWPRHPLPHSVL